MGKEVYFCDLSELSDSQFLVRMVEGKSIGCIRTKDRIFCALNYCPHEGAEVCRGYVGTLVKRGEVGCFDYDPDKTVVVCPWHKWEFSTETGDPVVPGVGRLKLFQHSVKDAKVFIVF
jgi:nitrite reductase (NADH) small subunit